MLARLGQMLRRIDSAGVGGGCRAPPRASHGRDVGACATFRDNSLDYAGLPGECWIPVPLPPPPRRRSAPNIGLRFISERWHRQIDLARASGTPSWPFAEVPSYAGPEGNNLVVGVMPNVGASQPWNPGPLAPVTGDLFFVHSEI